MNIEKIFVDLYNGIRILEPLTILHKRKMTENVE